MEYKIPPGTLIAPLHTHRREDEYSYVVSGEVGAQIGDQVVNAEVHGLLVKPRGTPHTVWNPGDVTARVLEVIAPGGFERCLAELYRPGEAPSPTRLQELWTEYAIEMQPDSVPGLLRDHGLRALLAPL